MSIETRPVEFAGAIMIPVTEPWVNDVPPARLSTGLHQADAGHNLQHRPGIQSINQEDLRSD
jgi:hypothetical protein